MKSSLFNKRIDEALEAALADLASTNTNANRPVTVTEPEERGKEMSTCTKASRNDSEHDCVNRADSIFTGSERERNPAKLSGIIDHKLTLLAVAGAAVNADAEPCLDKIVHELAGTGVTKADIREAVKSGRFLGVRPDLAAKVFERDCADSDEHESQQTVRSNSTILTTAQSN